MKDFENDLIYYPNPDPIEEPRFILNSVEELEKSTKYSVICNGTERVVYHTDSFDYVVVVDDEAYDLEISPALLSVACVTILRRVRGSAPAGCGFRLSGCRAAPSVPHIDPTTVCGRP